MEKHNGWTNYATWRINLEIFDGSYEEFSLFDPDQLKEYVEDILEDGCSNDLTLSYAQAFLSDVNFYEIEEAIKNYNEEEEDEE